MANPQLTVEITAKIDGLRDSFNKAIRETGNLDKSTRAALSSIDKSFENLANDIDRSMDKSASSTSKASSQITKDLAKAAQVTATSGRSISNGASQAGNALTNLGRIAQDAPFGFIGIQNNLNPLLESFQRLKQETGSTGAAFKALGSSLIGAGGLGLALSLVSSAVLLYQQYQSSASKATEAGAKANEDYQKSLSGITEAAGQNLARLSILYAATQDANRPLAERKRIVDELQAQYPSYFGNLKDEAILAGKAAGAYEKLQQELINVAIVKASEGLLSGQFKKLAELGVALAKVEQRFGKVGINQDKNGKLTSTGVESVIVDENGDLKEIRQYKEAITTEIKRTQNSFTKLFSDFSPEALIGDFTPTQEKKLKEKYKGIYGDAKLAVGELVKIIGTIPEIDLSSKVNLTAFTEKSNYALNQLRSSFGYTNDELEQFITNYGLGFDEILAKTVEFNDKISSSINGGIISAFSGIGEAIGSSLSGGTDIIQALGGTLLTVFGDLLINLGKIAIETGVGIAAIKTALKSLNPAVAIGAGIALIALGSLIKGRVSNLGGGNNSSNSKSTAIPAFANGVTNFGGGMALVGERGAELVNLPKGSSVIPNRPSMNMLKSAGNSMPAIFIEQNVTPQGLALVVRSGDKILARRGV